jgi:topoisomerase-4 subunit A
VQVVGYAAGEAATPLVLATTLGYGFTCSLGDLVSRQKAGKQFLTVEEPALPLAPLVVQAASDNLVACLSSLGRLLVFEAAELRQLAGGGRGVILMDLQLGETLLAVQPCGAAGLRITGTGRGGKPAELDLKGKALEAYRGKRARKGRALEIKFKAERLARLAERA